MNKISEIADLFLLLITLFYFFANKCRLNLINKYIGEINITKKALQRHVKVSGNQTRTD